MSFINKILKAEVVFEGMVIIAKVNLDWVNQDVYINSVIYEETDIKSILSDASEEELENNLAVYCMRRRL